MFDERKEKERCRVVFVRRTTNEETLEECHISLLVETSALINYSGKCRLRGKDKGQLQKRCNISED